MSLFRKRPDDKSKSVTEDTTFTELVGGLLTDTVFLTLDNYEYVWNGLEHKDNLSHFAAKIIRLLNTFEKSKDKHFDTCRKRIALAPNHDFRSIVRQSLFTTLAYVSLFYNVPHSDAITVSVNKWMKNHKTKYPYIDKLIEGITTESKDSKWILQTLKVVCGTSFNRGITLPLPSEADSCANAYALNYFFVRKCAEGPENRTTIFEYILEELRNAERSGDEGAFLSLAHVIRVLVTELPLERKSLQDAVHSLRPFALWPQPLGHIARELLGLLNQEIETPGSLLRARLCQEVPALTDHAARNPDARLIHTIFNRDSHLGGAFQALSRSEKVLDASAVAPMAALILHVLLSELDLSKDVVQKLESCPLDAMTRAYEELCTILTNTSPIESGNNANERRDRLELLWNKLQEASARAADAGSTPRRISVSRVINGVLGRRRQSMLSSLQSCGIRLADSACALEFELHDVTLPKSSQPANGVYAQYPSEPVMKTADALIQIIQRATIHLDLQHSPSKVPVKVGVAGGDSTLHSFVAAYIEVMRRKPQYSDFVEIHCYPFPFGAENSVPSFLGQFCGWYQRHVMGMCCTPLHTVPALAMEGAEDKGEQPKANSVGAKCPAYFTKMSLQDYWREARIANHFVVHSCQVWTDNISKNDVPAMTIPFLQSAEISTKGCGSDGRLRIKYYQVDLLGTERRLPVEESCNNNTVLFSAISKVRDPQVLANPLTPWLEMAVLEQDWAKRKRAIPYPTEHVASAELDGIGFQFTVTLDGVVYGPFTKIRLEPYRWKEDDVSPVTIPFMTFFPLLS